MDVSDTVQQQRAGPSFSLSYLFGNFILTLHFTAAPVNQCLFLMNTTQPNAQCSCLNHLQLPQLLRVNRIPLSSIAACSICPFTSSPTLYLGPFSKYIIHFLSLSVCIKSRCLLRPVSFPLSQLALCLFSSYQKILDNLKISTTHTCLLLSLTIILQ